MIKNFLRDETGLELSEYAVAAALIALAVVGVFKPSAARSILSSATWPTRSSRQQSRERRARETQESR